MTVKIGSARIDERGQASGGLAGDQTGKEVAIENYYKHSLGWWCLEPKSDDIANKLAEAMKQACANDCIGYDQSQRTGVISQLNKYGTLKKIAVKTECDCSSLVRACCIQAGIPDPTNFTTYNEKTKLVATGYFKTPFVVESEAELKTGSILVTKQKGHTVIVTEGKARGAVSAPTTPNADKKVLWVGKVTAGLLNVRKQPNKPKSTEPDNRLVSYPQIPKGTQVDVIKVLNGWLYVGIAGNLGYKYGYVSADYIKKA